MLNPCGMFAVRYFNVIYLYIVRQGYSCVGLEVMQTGLVDPYKGRIVIKMNSLVMGWGKAESTTSQFLDCDANKIGLETLYMCVVQSLCTLSVTSVRNHNITYSLVDIIIKMRISLNDYLSYGGGV